MVSALLAASGLAALLVAAELLWRRIPVSTEIARKSIHIVTGTFIAFLPFWVEYQWIKVLAIGFVLVNTLNHAVHFLPAITSVRRKSIGDILFGVGVLLVALFEPAPWLFAAAVMQVSIADGLAAIAGVQFAKKRGKYYVFGQPKSYIGSAVFILSSLLITVGVLFVDSYFADPVRLLPFALMLPLLLVCLENLAVYGFDNVVLPVVTLGLLSLL